MARLLGGATFKILNPVIINSLGTVNKHTRVRYATNSFVDSKKLLLLRKPVFLTLILYFVIKTLKVRNF